MLLEVYFITGNISITLELCHVRILLNQNSITLESLIAWHLMTCQNSDISKILMLDFPTCQSVKVRQKVDQKQAYFVLRRWLAICLLHYLVSWSYTMEAQCSPDTFHTQVCIILIFPLHTLASIFQQAFSMLKLYIPHLCTTHLDLLFFSQDCISFGSLWN